LAFKPIIKLSGHNGSIYTLIDGKDSKFFSCGGDGFLVEWNKSGVNPDGFLIARSEDPIYCGHLIEDKNILIAGSFQSNLMWIDITEKSILYVSKAHTKAIYDVKQIGDEIVSCGGDGKLIWHDIQSMKPSIVLQICNSSLRCIEIDTINKKIYVGSSDKNCYSIDIINKQVVGRYKLHDSSIFCMKIDGDKIYTGGRDTKLKSWSLPFFQLIEKIDAHNSTINSIAFLQDLIITSSKDKTIKVWTKDGRIVQTIYSFDGGHINSVNKVISLDEKYKFASCSDDRQVIIFDI
jgi:WD40 repeat protein